jgi:hypothetical protein
MQTDVQSVLDSATDVLRSVADEVLGQARDALGTAESEGYVHEVLAFPLTPQQEVECLRLLGHARAEIDALLSGAVRFLTAVTAHPACNDEQRKDADATLAAIRTRLPAEEFSAAVGLGSDSVKAFEVALAQGAEMFVPDEPDDDADRKEVVLGAKMCDQLISRLRARQATDSELEEPLKLKSIASEWLLEDDQNNRHDGVTQSLFRETVATLAAGDVDGAQDLVCHLAGQVTREADICALLDLGADLAYMRGNTRQAVRLTVASDIRRTAARCPRAPEADEYMQAIIDDGAQEEGFDDWLEDEVNVEDQIERWKRTARLTANSPTAQRRGFL